MNAEFLCSCFQLLKKEVEASQKPVEKACTQVISCLVDKVMSLDEQSSETASSKGVSQRLVSCLCTLFLFCKVKPDLLVKHTMTIQPYLNIKCNVSCHPFQICFKAVTFHNLVCVGTKGAVLAFKTTHRRLFSPKETCSCCITWPESWSCLCR